MTNFLRTIAEKLVQADIAVVNRIRMLAISTCSLVFAVVLYHSMFGAAPAPKTAHALALNAVPQEQAAVVPQPTMQTVSPKAVPAPAPEDGGDTDASQSATVEDSPAVPESALQYVAPAGEQQSVSPVPQDITAKAVIVTDDTAGRTLYERNADRELPEASLTKLMTAVVVREHTKLDDVVDISKDAVDTEGVAGSLRAGEQFTVGDLLKVMLIVSSNDAAVAFQEHLSGQGLDMIALMNDKAAELGMAHTHFANPDGLDATGHYTTARDLAKLVAFSLHDDALWSIMSERSDTVRSLNKKIIHQLATTNELLQRRVADVKGGKTGYTQNALGCMIAATEGAHPAVIVVLGSQDRFSDTKAFVSFAEHSL